MKITVSINLIPATNQYEVVASLCDDRNGTLLRANNGQPVGLFINGTCVASVDSVNGVARFPVRGFFVSNTEFAAIGHCSAGGANSDSFAVPTKILTPRPAVTPAQAKNIEIVVLGRVRSAAGDTWNTQVAILCAKSGDIRITDFHGTHNRRIQNGIAYHEVLDIPYDTDLVGVSASKAGCSPASIMISRPVANPADSVVSFELSTIQPLNNGTGTWEATVAIGITDSRFYNRDVHVNGQPVRLSATGGAEHRIQFNRAVKTANVTLTVAGHNPNTIHIVSPEYVASLNISSAKAIWINNGTQLEICFSGKVAESQVFANGAILQPIINGRMDAANATINGVAPFHVVIDREHLNNENSVILELLLAGTEVTAKYELRIPDYNSSWLLNFSASSFRRAKHGGDMNSHARKMGDAMMSLMWLIAALLANAGIALIASIKIEPMLALFVATVIVAVAAWIKNTQLGAETPDTKVFKAIPAYVVLFLLAEGLLYYFLYL